MAGAGGRAPEADRVVAATHVFEVGDTVSVNTKDAWGKDWAVMKHGTRSANHGRTECMMRHYEECHMAKVDISP